MNKWHKRFIKLAEFIAKWSKDPSTKVGAVITDKKHRIVSMGFNGYPQNIPDDDLDNRKVKYAKILHAECNSILFAKKDLTGCTIYVWPLPPCGQCMSMIIQSGIDRVVTIEPAGKAKERWKESNDIAFGMAKDAGIIVDFIS